MLTIITPFTGVYFISILISSTVRPFPYPSRPSLFRERAGTHSFTGSNRIINLFYPIMKESIFSFFNAPITNQVSNGVVCVSQLHAYITTSEWLRERTDQVRAASGDYPMSPPPVSSPTAGKITCYCRRASSSSTSITFPHPKRRSVGGTRCSPTSGYAPISPS